MKLTATLVALLLIVSVRAGAQAAFDKRQVEREVMSVLDAFFDAFNRQDARAEERSYHFPPIDWPVAGYPFSTRPKRKLRRG